MRRAATCKPWVRWADLYTCPGHTGTRLLPLLGAQGSPKTCCPGLGVFILLPSAWQCLAREFPSVIRWGILPNWSEWVAYRWIWKHPLGGVVGKVAPHKG